MNKRAQLQVEQSEKRQRVNELLAIDELTDEQRAELDTLTKRLQQIEPELRAAIVVEADEEKEIRAQFENENGREAETAEQREARELREKCRLGNFVFAAVRGVALSGPEAELRAELNLSANEIPTEFLDVQREIERRAETPAPGTVGVNLGTVQPFVFAPSVASNLGIEIRDVPTGTYGIPVITTAPGSPAFKAAKAAADSTAGALSVKSADPRRLPVRLTVTLEDVAKVGVESFESALRDSLQMGLSNAMDSFIINGDGTDPETIGLIEALTDATAQGEPLTFSNAVSKLASYVDGHWAMSCDDLSVLVGVETYRQLASLLQSPLQSGAQGEMSIASYLMRELAGLRTNSKMPAKKTSGTLNKNQEFIVHRMGHPGVTSAVLPSWGRVAIDDVYSDSGKGMRHLTLSALVGDLLLVQSDAYAMGAFQLDA